jgi:putative Mn2+ efflux pump MntP
MRLMYAAKQYIQRFCTSVLFCCIHESFCVFRYFLKKKGKGDFVMALVIELFLLGVGLSMDAFAVSVCKGLGMKKLNKKQALIIGLYFGGFQALMPFVGWLLGSQFQKYITSIDHWIAFILLGFIGGKMMIEAVREWNEEEVVDVMDAPIDHKNMLVLAVATSIDALTVGITFAFLGTPIVEAITIIGITTMVISIAGVVVGNFFGSRYKSKAEFIGGLILVLLGLKILLEHLGILVF